MESGGDARGSKRERERDIYIYIYAVKLLAGPRLGVFNGY